MLPTLSANGSSISQHLNPLSCFSAYLLQTRRKHKMVLMNIYVNLEDDPKVTKIIVSRGDRLQ